MRGYNLCFVLTNKCNLRCPHCYQEDKNASLTEAQIGKIIENLDDCADRIDLEGGEVYCEREKFYSTIKLFRGRFGDHLSLRVNTNGVAFYENRETILKEADLLHSLGVDSLRISAGKFHSAGGADRDKTNLIEKVLEDEKHPLKVKYLNLSQAIAIGSAESLPESQQEKRACMNKPGCLEYPHFFSDVLGNVYTCTWRITPPIGNLLTEKLGSAFNRLEDIQKKILVGDVRSFAKDDYLKKVLDSRGECMLCKEVFKNENK
ncbi:MAG: 4Fe-4S cluster-binding domain-containing protein [Nanoarchaeota archaeon]|nr:4Fe-4S cluster-binding domain-containing protein [Nanoarchaeota archaeon]